MAVRINKHIILGVVLVILFAILAQKELIRIAGVKPNLLLILFACLPFFIPRVGDSVFLIFFGSALLRWEGVNGWQIFVFLVLGIAYLVVGRRLQWRHYISGYLLMVSGTLLLWTFASPIVAFHEPFTVVKELIINTIVGGFVYFFMSLLYGETRYRTSL